MDWEKYQQENINRFLEGEDAWNKWAEEMLHEKDELEKAGKWEVSEKRDSDLHQFRTMSSISETQNWLDRALVDFSSLHFLVEQSSKYEVQGEENRPRDATAPGKSIFPPGYHIDFSNFIFPSDAKFSRTTFTGDVDFSGATFTGDTEFSGATFTGDAEFSDATFIRIAQFREATFIGDAEFSGATFTSFVLFSEATFTGDAEFNGTTFTKFVLFTQTTFIRTAQFREATFTGDAWFNQSDFKTFTNFKKTRFHRHADFKAIHVEGGFSLANVQFTTQVPNFIQAHFKEAPRLDNVSVITPPNKILRTARIKNLLNSTTSKPRWIRKLMYRDLVNTQYFGVRRKFWVNQFKNKRRDKNEEARYRALKRLAIQAHDNDNEQKFFAGELRARRHIRDLAKPWKSIASSVRYWSGVFYDLTSDFGRSLWRPFVLWVLVFCLFSQLYLCQATALSKGQCTNTENMTPNYAAKTIAAKNSLLFLGMDRTGKLKRAYACLYGASDLYKIPATKAGSPRLKNGYKNIHPTSSNMAPNVPAKVSALGILHSILSLGLIFLFFLALRNQFKIK